MTDLVSSVGEPQRGWYGPRVARDTGVPIEEVRVLSSKTSGIAATLLKLSAPKKDPTQTTPKFDGFILSTPVSGIYKREVWIEGRQASQCDTVRPGWFSFMDLRQSMSLLFHSSFNFVQFYIPRKSLDEVSDELGSVRISEFPMALLSCHFDPVIQALTEIILPSFSAAELVSPLYIDSVLRAASVHLATVYGKIAPLKPASGGLAPWQQKRIEDFFDANLAGDMALVDLAAECGLSTSHFTRAFRATFGMPPHRFLTERRITRAKDLMATSSMTLSEIAMVCGFADQSHFARVFGARVGVTPRRWREGGY